MLDNNDDLGASLFKTWTEKQRSDEIEKLVQGFRNGIPVGILCKMARTVALAGKEIEDVRLGRGLDLVSSQAVR